jgi:AraC-like DNA-binding protein
LRARDEPTVSRLDYWRHLVCDTIVPFDLRIDAPPDFDSHMLTGDMGPVRVVEMATLPSQVLRTPTLIRRSDPEMCKIDVQLRERIVVQQDDRQACLEAGDFSLVDLSKPCHMTTTSAQVIAVMFPRAMLPLRQDELAQVTAVRFPGDQSVNALVTSVARQLVRCLDEGDGGFEGVRLGAAMLDLVTVALAARLDRRECVPQDTRQRALVLRVHAYIEQHLGDPELSTATIATAHHISVRYLQKLFEEHGLSVSGAIRRRRLERCRRDLLDPAQRSRPVSAIAARWGFTSAVHFNRVFREAYGLPPGQYRRACGGTLQD